MTSPTPHWHTYFQQPRIAWLAVATQNPAHGIICANLTDVYQIYAWQTETGDLRQLTEQPNGSTVGAISADGETVYYLHDTQGGGIGHFFKMSFDRGLPADLTPRLPAYMSFYVTEAYNGQQLGLHVVNQEGFQVYTYDSNGTRIISYQNPAFSVGPNLSHDGDVLVIATTEKTGDSNFSLEAYEVQTGAALHELWDGVGTTIQPIGFIPQAGDTRFLAASNKTGVLRPLIWNPRTGERQDLDVPEIEGEVLPWDATPNGKMILLRQLHRAQITLWRYNIDTQTTYPLPEIPTGTLESALLLPSGDVLALHQDSQNPPRIIELNGTTGAFKQTRLQLNEGVTASKWESIEFISDDEVPIQAWLAKPASESPLPTIIHVHSGPADVQTERFEPMLQAWLSEGFAVCSVNYRGSTSFGIDFETAVHGQPSVLELADCAAAAIWLIDKGIADEQKLFIMGTAYGGSLALKALGAYPDLWAGALAVAAVADWSAIYAEQDETLQAYQHTLFGGTPADVPEIYADASPITHVAHVTAPALVIQGFNDPRTPHAQMETYIQTMQKQGKSITAHWFDATQPLTLEDRIQHQQWMFEFISELI